MNSGGFLGLGGGAYGMNAFGKRPLDGVDSLTADEIKVKRLKIGYPPESTSYDMPESKGNLGDVLQTNISGDAVWAPPSVVGATYEYCVYRPGGVSSANIAATWPEVVTFIGLGVLNVYIDSSIVSPAPITADASGGTKVWLKPYNFSAGSPSTCKFDADIQLTDFAGVEGPLQVELNSPTRANFAFSPGAIVRLVSGAHLHATVACTTPPILMDTQLILSVAQGGAITTDGPTVLEIPSTQTVILVTLQWTGAASTDNFISAAASDSNLLWLTDASTQGLSFLAFTGNLNQALTDQARLTSYDDSLVPPVTGALNVQAAIDYLKAGTFGEVLLLQGGVPKWTLRAEAPNAYMTRKLPSNVAVIEVLDGGGPPTADQVTYGVDLTQRCNVIFWGQLRCVEQTSVTRGDNTAIANILLRDLSDNSNGWIIGQDDNDAGQFHFRRQDAAVGDDQITIDRYNNTWIRRPEIGLSGSTYTLPTVTGSVNDVLTLTAPGVAEWQAPAPSPGLNYTNAWFSNNANPSSWVPATQTWIPITGPGGNLLITSSNNALNWTTTPDTIQWNGGVTATFNVTCTLTHRMSTGTFTRSYALWFDPTGVSPAIIPGSTITTVVGLYQQVSVQSFVTMTTGGFLDLRLYNEDANTTSVIVSDLNYNIVQVE